MPANVHTASKKPLVGLTGGIASGKSTVASFLRGLGVAVVDADQISREVVAKGSDGLAEIVQLFGQDFLTEQGELNREKMAAHVFADSSAREKLNRIVHPRVATRSAEQIATMAQTNTPYVVYDVPLLVEAGLHKAMDAVVVVAAPQATQVQRVQQRDGLTETAATARINAQFPLEKKIEVADYVIDNNGTIEDLKKRTEEVHLALLHRFSINALP